MTAGMKFHEEPLATLEPMIQDNRIAFEPKIEGTRVISVITPGVVKFCRLDGSRLDDAALQPYLAELAIPLCALLDGDPGEIVLDGVLTLAGEYHLFDMPYCRFGDALEAGPWIRPTTRFARRREALESVEIAGELRYTQVRFVAQARGEVSKRALFNAACKASHPGVIAKDLRAPYVVDEHAV